MAKIKSYLFGKCGICFNQCKGLSLVIRPSFMMGICRDCANDILSACDNDEFEIDTSKREKKEVKSTKKEDSKKEEPSGAIPFD